MARIKGIEIKDSWRVIYALTQVKGVGWSVAEKILGKVKINLDKRVKDLSADELSSLSAQVDTYVTEGDLVRQVQKNIARLQAIGAYRGVRHNRRLPVRGQRTKSNARSRRGERKTVGSFRKEVLTKMQQTK